jgi:RNA-directed DNA polymerase
MERREPQKLNRKNLTQNGHRAVGSGKKSESINLELELQTNSWLRIGLSAKDKDLKFSNLFCHFTVANFREAFRALDGSKAVGIDGITKRDYGQNLDVNLESLVTKLHKGTYRPQAKRGTLIPKTDGKTRPIAIASFEDKLVEWVLAKCLSAIYEPLFINESYGFRPRRSTFDAIKTLYQSLKDKKRPFVVEIDLKSFFDTVPHQKLIKMIQWRVTDPRILSLIARFLTVGIWQETGDLKSTDQGTPQGSIVSPVLANVFLHYVLDRWFVENYAKHSAVITRYADDAVFTFKTEDEAKLFYEELNTRLNNYGLTLNEDKSGMINFRPKTERIFSFVGFTFYWGKGSGGKRRYLRVKTEKVRLFKKVQEYIAWLKSNRNRIRLIEIWETTKAKLRGHYNYYGVYTNRPGLEFFYWQTLRALFKWLNRRSQKKSYNWVRFKARLRQHPLPRPPKADRLKLLDNRRLYA